MCRGPIHRPVSHQAHVRTTGRSSPSLKIRDSNRPPSKPMTGLTRELTQRAFGAVRTVVPGYASTNAASLLRSSGTTLSTPMSDARAPADPFREAAPCPHPVSDPPWAPSGLPLPCSPSRPFILAGRGRNERRAEPARQISPPTLTSRRCAPPRLIRTSPMVRRNSVASGCV